MESIWYVSAPSEFALLSALGTTSSIPPEGMALVRNRWAMITGADEVGRMDIQCSDGLGAESEQVFWEVQALKPHLLAEMHLSAPMDPASSMR